MKFNDFQDIFSASRISRYLSAVSGDKKKATTLYRLNLRLSQELFTIESCFEISLRNKIDIHYLTRKGTDWLRDSALPGGMFNVRNCGKTPYIISQGLRKLTYYSHNKLIAEMEFGFWRYLFARHQFYAGGQTLLNIFPLKPHSTITVQYNYNYIFTELEKINKLRNRIAHHEPICFLQNQSIKDTTYARTHYGLIIQLFQWMDIDETAMLYGIDHINEICYKIDNL